MGKFFSLEILVGGGEVVMCMLCYIVGKGNLLCVGVYYADVDVDVDMPTLNEANGVVGRRLPTLPF